MANKPSNTYKSLKHVKHSFKCSHIKEEKKSIMIVILSVTWLTVSHLAHSFHITLEESRMNSGETHMLGDCELNGAVMSKSPLGVMYGEEIGVE